MKKSLVISMMTIALSHSVMANGISFPCFESMATVYGQAKAESQALSAADQKIIDAALADAIVRAKEKASMLDINPEVRIHRAYQGKISGLNIVTSNDSEYGSYFLYSYSDYSKELSIMSEHLGDDQGPELNVICSGWGPGDVVKKF